MKYIASILIIIGMLTMTACNTSGGSESAVKRFVKADVGKYHGVEAEKTAKVTILDKNELTNGKVFYKGHVTFTKKGAGEIYEYTIDFNYTVHQYGGQWNLDGGGFRNVERTKK